MDKDKQQLWQSKKHLIYLIRLISMVAMSTSMLRRADQQARPMRCPPRATILLAGQSGSIVPRKRQRRFGHRYRDREGSVPPS